MKLYRSNQMERLAEALAAVLAKPSPDPMMTETVIVQSRGMERWLSMNLAEHLGVCANVAFPFPRGVIRDTLSHAMEVAPSDWEAWAPDSMMWSVLECLRTELDAPAMEPLRRYLEAAGGGSPDLEGREAVALSREIADVFDRYLTYRPEMILKWDGGTFDPEDWQPMLWRAVRERIGARHLAELARDFIEGRARCDLSTMAGSRLCVFGISTLPPLYLSILSTLATKREVHLFVLCASNGYWGHIRSKREIARLVRRSPDSDLSAADLQLEEGNPLLASLGRLGRDFQVILEGLDASTPYVESEHDLFVSATPSGALETIQYDILQINHRGRAPAGAPSRPPRKALEPQDQSISIHGCYGPMRQVEALYDHLLDRLQGDPSLQPRDVVVMTPDLALYAPLIDAVFNQHSEHQQTIPYRLADRPLGANNDAADVVLKVLDLTSSRISSRELLDLVNIAAVRRRFGLTDDHVTRIQDWVISANIRWGIDSKHRDMWRQPPVETHTWREGFRRLLLGAAMAHRDDLLVGPTAPLEYVEGGDAVSLGRFIDLCEAVFGLIDALHHPRSLKEWSEVVHRITSTLVELEESDQWRVQELLDLVQGIARSAESANFEEAISLGALRSLLAKQLDHPPRASGFVTGAVTVCAMVPMRSVPFKVICLLGMDDDSFPRQPRHVGFDLTKTTPRLGDRNPRDEDRYLLLEAFLAARETLSIFYTARSLRSGSELPPAVPIGEFIDVLKDSFGPERTAAMMTAYPLQPFSPRVFGVDEEGSSIPPLSFSSVFADAADTLRRPKVPESPRYAGPLKHPPVAQSTVELDALIAFFKHPAKWFCLRSLRLRLGHDEDHLEEREPLMLGGLERWHLRRAGLAAQSDARDMSTAKEHLKAAGLVPYGTPGQVAIDRAMEQGGVVAAMVSELTEAEPKRVPLSIDLEDRRLEGVLTVSEGFGSIGIRMGKLRESDRFNLWIRHLVLIASDLPGLTQSALFTMRDPPLVLGKHQAPEDAKHTLRRLIELAEHGMREPLAFFPEASYAYAAQTLKKKRSNTKSAAKAARDNWLRTGSFGPPGEGEDAYNRVLWGNVCPFERSPDSPDWPEEPDPLWAESLALELWLPFLNQVAQS